jgi:1-acyl-sn-glycerol-3-phosphate acyltransferase
MKTKRPNAVLYFIAFILFYPAFKLFFRLKVDRKNLTLPKGPHIILANHTTMVDFLLVMLPLYPQRVNVVTAQKFFLYRPLHKLLPMMGCIPKNMFDPDIRSMIGIKEVLKRGDGVLLFPEGRCSTSGNYVGINRATGKMIKKLGVPVISAYVEGAHMCIPHWRKGVRFGRERVTLANLFSEEDIKSLSIDEINTAIDARLSGEEGVSPPEKPFQTFKAKRLAEGLHFILYWCPKCKKDYTMESKGNTIHCTACGNTADMDRAANLIPSGDGVIPDNSISSWFRDQVRNEMRTISDDMDPIIEKVTVRTPTPKPGGGMVENGQGMMRLDTKGWRFDGEISGKQVNLFFPVETVPAMSYDHSDNFQVFHKGAFYKFVPEDTRKCLKYAILSECLHWKFSQRRLMTPGKNSGFVEC